MQYRVDSPAYKHDWLGLNLLPGDLGRTLHNGRRYISSERWSKTPSQFYWSPHVGRLGGTEFFRLLFWTPAGFSPAAPCVLVCSCASWASEPVRPQRETRTWIVRLCGAEWPSPLTFHRSQCARRRPARPARSNPALVPLSCRQMCRGATASSFSLPLSSSSAVSCVVSSPPSCAWAS